MKRYVLLLRGVMPTGRNKVPMAPLRAALEKAGLAKVQTYIQSGNVVAESNLSQARLEKLVREEIRKNFGGNIAVVARTADQFRETLHRNPFARGDTTKLYFTLLAEKPDAQRVKDFANSDYSPDKIRVIDGVVYTLCATKYSDLRVNNNFIERKLGVVATTRNFNTMTRLVELSEMDWTAPPPPPTPSARTPRR